MKSLTGTILAFVFLAIPFASFSSEGLSKEYLTQKFANMTVKGFHNKRKFAFTRYYYTDGTVIARSEKYGDRTGRWRMENNIMCEAFGGKERCRRVEELNGVIYKFSKQNKKIVTYGTFTAGNDLLDHSYVLALAKK